MRLIEYEDLSKKIIEIGVKEKDFLPFSPYVAEIAGYPYGGKIPGKAFKYKLGLFDLDGTLNKIHSPDLASLIISNLIEKCGIEKERILRPIRHLLQYKNFEGSEEELTKVLKSSNFNFDKYVEISQDVSKEFQPIRNCKECISFMRENNYYCGLLSQSFDLPVKLIGKKLGFDESHGSQLYFDEKGNFVSFHWLRKEELRDKKFAENSVRHGCYFILDDDPNFAPVLKSGINPYFIVKEVEVKPFDIFICVPEVREKDDMLLLKDSTERWESMYIEVYLNPPDLELEKVRIANEAKKALQKLRTSGQEIFARQFSLNVSKYLHKEIRPERRTKLLTLLTLFEGGYNLAIAEEIDSVLSRYPAYKMSEKLAEVLESFKC
jgi:phosphoserine phosphatase